MKYYIFSTSSFNIYIITHAFQSLSLSILIWSEAEMYLQLFIVYFHMNSNIVIPNDLTSLTLLFHNKLFLWGRLNVFYHFPKYND